MERQLGYIGVAYDAPLIALLDARGRVCGRASANAYSLDRHIPSQCSQSVYNTECTTMNF